MLLLVWATLSAGGHPIKPFAGVWLLPSAPHHPAMHANLRGARVDVACGSGKLR